MSARVEAKIVVPTGGAAVSVSSGALTSAVVATVPAGSFYLTAAGGVDSIVDELEEVINAAVSPYPDNDASMAAAVGYGVWSAGWSFQIASGNDTGMFGGVTLTANGTPTYSNTGPGNGGDLAIGFDANTEYFDGGANFDVGANDLIVAWVGKWSALPSTAESLASKLAAAYASGWAVYAENTAPNYGMFFSDGGGGHNVTITGAAEFRVGEWHVGIACIDRSTGMARFGVRGLTTATTSVSAETAVSGNVTTAATFRVGADATQVASTTFQMAGLYVGTGSGVATGLSANLSTALSSFASAVSSAFTVSIDTASTGRATLANSFWPASIDFTSTNLRDVLGFDQDFNYPEDAETLTTALGGYGVFTGGAGYLCNEASGDLASVFGTPATLTAVSTPTYSNVGARGGTDKAVGFDSGTDAFSAADAFDVGASDDLIAIWVAKSSTATPGNNDILSKWGGATQLWLIWTNSDNYKISLNDGVTGQKDATASSMTAHWHVGIAVIDRGANATRIGWHSLLDGSSSVSTAVSISGMGSLANAVSMQLGDSGSGFSAAPTTFKISALYIVSGSSVATGLSANLSTALSSFAAYMKSQTGTEQARGIWFTECPLNLEGDPAVAPRVTDTRYSQSPTGFVLALSGNSYYRHRGLVWSHVPRSQVWEAAATYANGSYETFAKDAFYGMGHAWFTPASPVQIYWNDAGTDRALGYTFNSSAGVPGWAVINVASTEPKKSSGDWTGLWRIEFGDVIAEGE